MKELDVKLDRPMTAAVPVSLREPGNEDPNNQVTMMLASLATDVKDPLERLRAINASTTSSKELTGAFKAAIPTDFPSFGAPWIMTGLATLFGRSKISDQMPPMANVAISNVPGVPVPLFVAGAKLATYFPVSIPAHGCALNITVQSYNGSLDYGLTACRRAVPDVADIADYIVEEHAVLAKLVMAQQPQPAANAADAGVQAKPAPKAAEPVPAAPRAVEPQAVPATAAAAIQDAAGSLAHLKHGNGHARNGASRPASKPRQAMAKRLPAAAAAATPEPAVRAEAPAKTAKPRSRKPAKTKGADKTGTS
jgi:hypothetical protein